ncbi:MAG: PDZ domain-containing protein, partial [Rikenellaceae bacterium]|nr:PDZ domain-containing protein [Rikenellaceae bacterium]
SENLRLGEWVIAVGSPYGLNSTVTAGIISAKGRNLDVIPDQFRLESFIQTDAAVNPGNSGGALVNTSGELVGINTVIKSPTGSYAGYSFAVPSNIVKKVVVDLMEYGFVQRALMGIGYNEINDDFIEARGKELGISNKGGLYVGSVDENGAAAAAGIKKGDIIISIDGVKTDKSSNLQSVIAQHRPNDKVAVEIKRGSQVKQLEVVLRNKAGEAKLLDKNSVDVVASLGGKFTDLNDKAKAKHKLSAGVQVVEVNGGLLAKAGIRTGYIITHINGSPIRSISDINRITEPVRTIDGLYPDGRYVSYTIVDRQ